MTARKEPAIDFSVHTGSLRWFTQSLLLVTCLAVSLATPPAAAENGSADSLCVKGQAISVLYAGTWYPAKVLDGLDRMGTCLVSYDGYGSNWDEWVNISRIRPVETKASAAAAAQQPTTPTVTSVPTGKYSCYTFDNGLLNYTYTDILIQTDGRYAVGDKGGSYTLSEDGTLSFTGALANAVGTFSVKNNGKPQIDLVFNGDTRASMSCPKAP